MNFANEVTSGTKLLVEGSMYDRLKRLAGDRFDPELAHLGLIYSDEGREALRTAYGEYIQASIDSSLPIVVFTPTWRANQERSSRSPLSSRNVNDEAAKFVIGLRDDFGREPGVFVGGLIGCKNDCYSPEQALSSEAAEKFHSPQVLTLASSGVDFLFASTLPSLSEALGIARAMAQTGKPYVLSFVADQSGAILDGTPLPKVFSEIDSSVSRKPLGFFVNCTHPTALVSGITALGSMAERLRGRLIGFQGNTSRRDPREFDSLPSLETEAPDDFAIATIELREKLGLNMLGGCCGTGPQHIRAIGSLLRRGT